MAKNGIYVVIGATGGIGSAVCRILHQQGALVIPAARDRQRLDALSAELGGAHVASLDACDIEAVDAFVRGVVERHGRIDGLANCVGSIVLKSAHATRPDEWREVVRSNLDSAFAAVRAGAKAMTKTGGSIVLMASAAGRVGLPNHEAIAAAKAGVIGLAQSAAATYAGRGIRVNAVAPGLVDTPMSAAITGSPLMLKASEAMHPLGRIGRPDEVAKVVTWLLGPDSSWVTGQAIGIDGGLSTVRGKATA
jgi:NAD(P)-dependent dehydrogenase (short-subunit alcohol dehydrogenase family)